MAQTNVVRIVGFTQPADDLSAAMDSFLACCKSRNLSGCTIGYYRYRLQALKLFLSENALTSAPKDISPSVIRDFLTDEAERNSPTTANHSHVTLSAFFAYLTSEGFIGSSPMANVEKPRRRNVVINTFSLEQIDDVLMTCGKDFPGVRDRAMIMMVAFGLPRLPGLSLTM